MRFNHAAATAVAFLALLSCVSCGQDSTVTASSQCSRPGTSCFETTAAGASTSTSTATSTSTTTSTTTTTPTTTTTEAPTTTATPTTVAITAPPTTRAPVTTPPPTEAPDPAPEIEATVSYLPAFLICVRQRESGGNYSINTGNGYYGAFQFSASTWRNTANHAGRPDLAGMLPSSASPADQDAMAIHLYGWQGRSPWAGPGC